MSRIQTSRGTKSPGSGGAGPEAAVIETALDRSGPPRVGEAKAFRFPDVAHGSTRGGLQVLAIRRTDTPLVSLRFVNRAGAHFDPPAQGGLASFVGSLLDEGTRHRSAVTTFRTSGIVRNRV